MLTTETTTTTPETLNTQADERIDAAALELCDRRSARSAFAIRTGIRAGGQKGKFA